MTRCIAQRLWAKTVPTEDGCWNWTGGIDPTGYGRISAGGTMGYTHRVAVELFHGPIPDGMDVDHLCRNRACCNPAHLEVVTRQENLLRGETLTAAHKAGVDCGFSACRSCARHRLLPADTGSAA